MARTRKKPCVKKCPVTAPTIKKILILRDAAMAAPDKKRHIKKPLLILPPPRLRADKYFDTGKYGSIF